MIDADRLQLHMPLQKHHKNNVKLIQHNIGCHSEDQGIWLWYDLEWTSVVPQLTSISVTSDYLSWYPISTSLSTTNVSCLC